ncbi:MAG: roadblock/LC7 domain-containing protein [Phormidesmis sp.]
MAIDTARLNNIIRAFVTDTSHVQGAALVSPEGLSLAGSLPEELEESRAAAMTAAVIVIGDRIGDELRRGPTERVILEGLQGYSILTRCGSEALFLVLASLDVKQGILLIEIRRIVEEMATLIG